MAKPRTWKRGFIVLLDKKANICLFGYSTDLIASFPTKRTPVMNVQFTPRNLCVVGGTYLSSESR